MTIQLLYEHIISAEETIILPIPSCQHIWKR